MSGIVQSHDVPDGVLVMDEHNTSSFHFQNFKRLGRLFGDVGSVTLLAGPNRKLKLTPVTPGSVSFLAPVTELTGHTNSGNALSPGNAPETQAGSRTILPGNELTTEGTADGEKTGRLRSINGPRSPR